MKYTFLHKKRIIIWVSVFILLFLTTIISVKLFFFYKQDYQKRYDELSENAGMFNYTMWYDSFFSYKFRYPKNKKELLKFYVGSIRYSQLQNKMKDPLSRHNKEFLYVPVYSKINHLCEEYLLISAGIDGKIDNIINDTIFSETVKELKFYNNVVKSTTLTYRKFKNNFNLINYFFGNKDLLIGYKNGIDVFRNNSIRRIFTPSGLMKNLYPKGFSKYDCCVRGKAKKLNNKVIIIYDSTHKVFCNMYKGRKNYQIQTDTIKIVGQFNNKIDKFNNTVYLDNCIFITH